MKIVVVSAAYHDAVKRMMGIVEKELGASMGQMIVVSGAWELPLAVMRALAEDDVDGVVALGAIERGETGHGVAIAGAVLPALTTLSLEFDKPVALGVIGPEATLEQIDARVDSTAHEAIKAIRQQLGLMA